MPKPILQLRLSTLFVCMYLASILLLANAMPDSEVCLSESGATESHYEIYGWPATVFSQYVVKRELDPVTDGLSSVIVYSDEGWQLLGITMNAFSSLVIIGLVAGSCEWMAKRRAPV